jgi:hypothetical protein
MLEIYGQPREFAHCEIEPHNAIQHGVAVQSKYPPVIWWNNLDRIMLAVDDLGCRDLLS